jgi:hypothetical protein
MPIPRREKREEKGLFFETSHLFQSIFNAVVANYNCLLIFSTRISINIFVEDR